MVQLTKKILKSVLNNLPTQKVYAEVYSLGLNELLEGRTALVTGGTSGIGYEIAKAFLNSGCNVVITGRFTEQIQIAVNNLKKETSNRRAVLGVAMDNSKVETFEDCMNIILTKLEKLNLMPRIDILVNNAGQLGGDIRSTTEQNYDAVLNVNLKGAFFLSRLVAKHMIEMNSSGNILNIGSSSCLRPAISAYTLSKWGLRALTLGLAKTYAPYGITVNGLAPGPTATAMLSKDKHSNIANDKSPIGRYIMPEEISNMAVILVSPIGRSIVGDMIYMTGGAGLITYDDIDYSF